MRVPVRIFATRELLEQVMGDKSLEQAVNAATLPGLVGAVVVMPDMHQGYGFPIGGVAATEYPRGVISPGAIGYDINCGVRLLASNIEFESAQKDMDMLATRLNQHCPSGVGKAGVIKVSLKELDDVLRDGSHWARKNGYATEADLARTEETGSVKGADPASVSERAKQRGREQIGSVGAGNHFVEVDVVEQIFDEQAAAVMGLREGMLALQIHCGSRGLGHQVCTDYVREFQGAVRKYGIDLPDRELVCAPLDSPEGQAYLGAMRAAANFAFANRQLLAHSARKAFEETFAGKTKELAPAPGLRHRAQHGQDRNARSGWAADESLRASQGSHARLWSRCARAAARVQGHRAAGHHPRQHGDGILGAGRHGGEHDALVRVVLSRGGQGDVPQQGQENRPGG